MPDGWRDATAEFIAATAGLTIDTAAAGSWWRVVTVNPDTDERACTPSERDRVESAVDLADDLARTHIAVSEVTEYPSGRLVYTADPYGFGGRA
jgi:hypothetical protein